MNAALATVGCLVAYALGYGIYAKYVSRRVFGLREGFVTPAHELRDDVDYVPTNRWILFGHHYASITGLAPMLGPAVAVIWGWVPAMLWVVLGALFVGCVHDFGALVVSVRAKGYSIGKVTEAIIGKRAKTLFHLLIFFGVALAMGVFVFVIATLFSTKFYPQAVLPSAVIMILAVIMGLLLHKKNARLAPLTIGAFLITLLSIGASLEWPTMGLAVESWPSSQLWSYGLLAYAFAASVLPVWALLQSRDFINSLLLYLGLIAMYGGFFIAQPSFQNPPVNLHPEGAPNLFPFVFIVIACGAASGFHGLVSSGTTAKQLDREPHARLIGYGAMIGESLLGLMAVLACSAGFISKEHWHQHYVDWQSVQGLGNTISAFIEGSARFISSLGVSPELASSFVAVIVVSFALTTLDSATRLLRYNIEEIAESCGAKNGLNRYISSILAVLAIGFFAFYKIDGKAAGLVLWQLFGTTNQLLAALTLLVVTMYLKQRGKNYWVTFIPMLFMTVTTFTALFTQFERFITQQHYLLLAVTIFLLLSGLGLIISAGFHLKEHPKKSSTILDIHF